MNADKNISFVMKLQDMGKIFIILHTVFKWGNLYRLKTVKLFRIHHLYL